MIHGNVSLQRVETINLIRNWLIVRLDIIGFVDQIVLNHCIYILKINEFSGEII